MPPYTPIPMATTTNEDYLVDIEIGIKNLVRRHDQSGS